MNTSLINTLSAAGFNSFKSHTYILQLATKILVPDMLCLIFYMEFHFIKAVSSKKKKKHLIFCYHFLIFAWII